MSILFTYRTLVVNKAIVPLLHTTRLCSRASGKMHWAQNKLVWALERLYQVSATSEWERRKSTNFYGITAWKDAYCIAVISKQQKCIHCQKEQQYFLITVSHFSKKCVLTNIILSFWCLHMFILLMLTDIAIYLIACHYVQFSCSAFLLLYAIILLTDFHPAIGLTEIILNIWIFSLFTEKIRQVFLLAFFVFSLLLLLVFWHCWLASGRASSL